MKRTAVIVTLGIAAMVLSSAALARDDEVVRTRYTNQAVNTSQAQQALAKLRAQEAAIQMVLTEEGGSVKRASQRLGVTDRALQMRRSAARITAG